MGSWIAGCGVAALTVVTALAAGSRPLVGHGGVGGAVAARTGALTALGVVAALIGVGGAFVVLARPVPRDEADEDRIWTLRTPWREQAVAIAVAFALLAALPALFLIPGGASKPRPHRAPPPQGAPRLDVPSGNSGDTPWATVVFGLAGFGAFAGALGWFAWRTRRPSEPSPSEGPVEAAARAARAALDDADDDRAAIIAAYEALEAELAKRGIVRRHSEAPRELLGRASARGSPAAAVHAQRLTALFERARFAVAPIGAAERRAAEDALSGLEAAR